MPKVDRTKHIFKTRPHNGFEYTDVARNKREALYLVKSYPPEYHAVVYKPKANSKDADAFKYHIYTLRNPRKR